ncbi:P1 family peptidase [Veillonella sp. CHU740]|uniref:P1 family peptidase n=1 Tax=Veillonella sp. CHU740 TaxID=2490950 RepID=UPI000F8D0B23|nr:P1 family peptidase [Veillonella sp. CHU740]
MERITWNDIEFVSVGNATDAEGKTGITVLRFPYGATGGMHISGGGPAARESGVLDPTTAPTPVNALVLGGGSAFGLGASDGVMQSLEERNIGCPTAYGVVPIVCQSDIYDLSYGNPKARPTPQMAYDACEATFKGTAPISGNVGAGTGATVGKICGMELAMKGGIGYSAARLGDLVVGAVVVVNAFGDVYDREGQPLGGVMDASRTHIVDTSQIMYDQYVNQEKVSSMIGGNTTIGAIVTNAQFSKAELTKIAMMATNGYARSIRPVGTLSDGDTIYAFSSYVKECHNHIDMPVDGTIAQGSPVVPDVNLVGTLAADLMCEAIEDAMQSSYVTDDEFLENLLKFHEVKIEKQ